MPRGQGLRVSVGVCGRAVAAAAGAVCLVWTSVRDGVLDPLALSEVVGLPESMLRRLLPCTEFQGGASDSVLRCWGAPVPGRGWLMVQTVPKTVWRFLVVQKTTEISLLQFIDKVLPCVVAQRQIPMVLRGPR